LAKIYFFDKKENPMLPIKKILKDPILIETLLRTKDPSVSLEELINQYHAYTEHLSTFEKLKEKLNEMRSLTIKNAEEFSERLKELCAECGIALVYTPYVKNTNVNGATRWLTPKKALIQLSLRYTYADCFWFTFFHEIGHLIKHGRKDVYVDFSNGHDNSELEKEADQFAQKTLIPSNASFEMFKQSLTPENLKIKILYFSKENNIDTGIVAGRLAKETGKWSLVAHFRKQLCLREYKD